MSKKDMRAVASVACAAIAVIAATSALAQEETALTQEQKQLNLESFDYVWTKINDEYWDPELGGLDWEAVRDELRPKVEQATAMSEAREAMRQMISRLGKSHFGIFPADIYKNLEKDAAGDGATGIDLRVIDGHALATSVFEDSPAHKAGARPGWEITRIGEVDIVARLQELDTELEDDSKKPLRLAYAVIPRLMGPIGEEIAVTFLDGKGQNVQLEIPLAEPRGRKSVLGNLGEIRVWIEVKTVDENIGCIAFSGFADPLYVMKAFNDAMESFVDAQGIIIDLRGNSGGLGAMAMGMVGWLVKGNPELGRLKMRDNELKLVVQSRPETYAGPVAVLVDGLSGSASEFFSGGLQELGRACIVGSRTKGEALPGQFTTLPNGDVFLYATANFTSASGKALEGVGVTPDIAAAPTRADLLAGHDRALEAAIAWIKKQQ